MQADVARLDHQHQRGGSQQPQRGGDGVYVDNLRHGRLLVQVVVQIEAEPNAHEDPEDRQPNQRSPPIVTRRPRRSRMEVHPRCPPCRSEKRQSEKRTTLG
jgi:hypothetical protein